MDLIALAAALAIFCWMCAPGWLLAHRRGLGLPAMVAAGFGAQAAAMLLVALVAAAGPWRIDVRWALAVPAAMFVAIVLVVRPAMPPAEQRGPVFDPWMLLVPVLATVTAALISRGGILEIDGDLVVRAWFNADGFKHLGHVQSLAVRGLPARDIFAAGDPLSYYWLYYIVPATGAALHGDAARALIAAGLVQSFAFWMLVHGLLRAAGAPPRWAALFGLIGWLSPSLDGVTAMMITGWNAAAVAANINVEGLNAQWLNGFTLFRLSLYIPQHQFMLAGLLSWGLLHAIAGPVRGRWLSWLGLAPLAAAGALSTLLGVAALGVYGLTRLADRRDPLVTRMVEIVVVGAVALLTVLALRVVSLESDSGLASPIFADRGIIYPFYERFLRAFPGVIFIYGISLLAIAGIMRGWRERPTSDPARPVLVFASVLTVFGLAALIASTLLPAFRLAQEFQLRVSLLPYLGLTIGCAWMLGRTASGGWRIEGLSRPLAAVLLAIGLLTPALDAAWHVGSNQGWVIRIPADDRAVLAELRRSSPADAVVLSYPELPFVNKGADIWAPLLAGRAVPASYRATHFARQAELLDATASWYAGEGPRPEAGYGYVYLSRALHPLSYDRLAAELDADPGWVRDACRPSACLYRRRAGPAS